MKTIAALTFFLLTLPLHAQSWGRAFEELEVDRLVQRLSKEAKPIDAAFVGVNVIPMTGGAATILEDQTVIVRGGTIAAIGPRGAVAVPDGVVTIAGHGRFLAPGLTDAHVHTLNTSSDYLTQLTNGITTVREMAGFPFLLRTRAAIRANRILAPTSYVAGPLINYFPMDWYATVVKTPERGREVVRAAKRDGYDYVKLHNVVPLPIYDAILDTAAEEHIRVIGHLPHDILVKHAVDKGQFTLEHFKGFYLDTTLKMSTEDWLAAVKGADIWICPTLSTVEATMPPMTGPDAQLVSLRERRTWPQAIKENTASKVIGELSTGIFRALLPVTDRFIAGTDSGGGYPNSLPGAALHDELEMFESLGMPPAAVLRTATVNAAAALLDPQSFGTIEPGKRADLLLLDHNPLLTARNLRSPRGVMVRGIWLDRAKIDSIRTALRATYAKSGADKSLDAPSPKQISALVKGLKDLDSAGWIFRDQQLREIAELLRKAGRNEDAETVLGFIPPTPHP